LGQNPPVAALMIPKSYVGHSPLMMSSNMVTAKWRRQQPHDMSDRARGSLRLSCYTTDSDWPSLLRRAFLKIMKPKNRRSNANPVITAVMTATNFLGLVGSETCRRSGQRWLRCIIIRLRLIQGCTKCELDMFVLLGDSMGHVSDWKYHSVHGESLFSWPQSDVPVQFVFV
jgi:hypothetical protein